MKNLLFIILLLPFVSCTQILSTEDIIKLDYRNIGIDMEVHYKNTFNRDVIVFDIIDISSSTSMADVFRAFMQAASKLKEEKYEKVEFAFKGNSKMYINGTYFKKLGIEYGQENSLYTIRTFPENVKDMEGDQIFSTWTGGILGVMNKQMDDFNSFHTIWYINSLQGFGSSDYQY